MRVQILILTIAVCALAYPGDYVNYLVGADKENFDIYSGYLNVTNPDPKTLKKQIHYVLVETRGDDPEEAPVIVVVNSGGPGCSSLLSMFMENGPYVWDELTDKFAQNPYSWNQRANVLYLAGLPGVGYSFAADKANKQFNDVQSAQDHFDALMEFFKKFPTLADNPIYISGSLYGGIMAPYLAWKIHEYNTNAEITKKVKIPFKGIMVGNPITHHEYDTINSLWPFAYMNNLMDFDTWFTLEEDNCTSYYRNLKPAHLTQACIAALEDFQETTERINFYDIYRDLPSVGAQGLTSRVGTVKDLEGNTHFYDKGVLMSEFTPWLADTLSPQNNVRFGDGLTEYLNGYEFRREMNIPTTMQAFRGCEMDFDWHYDIQLEGSFWVYPLLKANGYKILVYSGDTDGSVPSYGTQRWISDLNWEVKEDWKPWHSEEGSWEEQQQVQGYTQLFDGLRFTTLHGVGLRASQGKKQAMLQVVNSFIYEIEYT